MSTKRACLFAASATLVGCATPHVQESAREHLDAEWVIYSSPGKYQTYRGELYGAPGVPPDRFALEFKFAKLQPSPEWAPTLLICAHGKDEIPASCMRFSALDKSKYLSVEARFDADESSAPVTTNLPERPVTSGAHSLEVQFVESAVKYTLDGVEVHEQSLPISPSYFSVTCSSAICNIRIITNIRISTEG